jgi:hypothetical protein
MNPAQIRPLLEKEINRKEFILTLGMFLITVIGISGMLKNISALSQGKQEKGFSSGPYGQ